MLFVSATLTRGKAQTAGMPTHVTGPSTKSGGLRCPVCIASVGAMADHALGQAHGPIPCRACSAAFVQDKGIWLALRQDRRRYFQRFMQDYEIVRRAEGRGSEDPAFYLS